MRKVRLAFRLEEDDRFLVMAQAGSQASSDLAATTSKTTYDHEDLFLKLVIYAELDDELTRRLVVAVILSVADPTHPGAWIAAEISAVQNEVLGLNLPPDPAGPQPFQPARNFGEETATASSFCFTEEAGYFYDVPMDAPELFTGPEHILTSVNPPCIRFLRRAER